LRPIYNSKALPRNTVLTREFITDGIYLQVIAQSGEGKEQRHAQRVHKLLNRGKHWVLVTLLLSNVIVNETLPIVLDRSLGGGWPAVLGSTALIVIFGEVIPQSICVRYGEPDSFVARLPNSVVSRVFYSRLVVSRGVKQ